jgi:hypothetical protein
MPHQRTLRLELPGDGAITLTVHHAKMLQRATEDHPMSSVHLPLAKCVRGNSPTALDLRWAGLLNPTTSPEWFTLSPLGSLALKLYRLFAD